MATQLIKYWSPYQIWGSIPFWPASLTACDQLVEELSNAPPMECIELAVEPRRSIYLLFEFGFCDESYLGKGYSLYRTGETGDVRLSIDCLGAEEDMSVSRPRGHSRAGQRSC
jgi:hypothetical protein